MSQMICLEQAAKFLSDAQDILILTHKSPDGDTIGSAFALMHALHRLGKRADVLCQDPIAPYYSYLFENGKYDTTLENLPFEPKTLVSVDVADQKLLGGKLSQYADRIDLSVDHHASNTGYAKQLLLRSDAAANCELMLDLIEAMGVKLDQQIVDSLYTGIVTDTGCFRYPSTTVQTHIAAQKLLLAGAQMRLIHRLMLESTSRGKVQLICDALHSLRYELDGKCAVISLMRDRINELQVTDDELEGLSSLPRSIEGVQVGVTLRQFKSYQGYKISVRTDTTVDACAICKRLGGGGHAGAAGCTIEGKDVTLEQAYQKILESVRVELCQ